MVENLGYTLVQIAHNFGAAIVLGGAVCARWPIPATRQSGRRIARLVLAGWIIQIASGLAFGAASYLSYGRLPDIHGIAVVALFIKIGCAVIGVALTAIYLRREPDWADTQRGHTWLALALLAATALTAAAFLRWFS